LYGFALRREPHQSHDQRADAAEEDEQDRHNLPGRLRAAGAPERVLGILARVDDCIDAEHEARDPECEESPPNDHEPTISVDSTAVLDPMATFRLDDKVALVTGASVGLGARFARVLDAAGARVVLAARRRERLEQLATELREALAVACDLSEDGAPEALVAATLAHYGRVDVLVNNAGVSNPTPAFDETTDKFENTVRVNLVAPFALAREGARAMVASGDGGTIVNVASIWGMVGVGQIPEPGYAASKGGLVNLTRELAAQWARQGVRVNCLAPGWFRSEMTEGLMFGDERAERWMRQRTPMGRGGEEGELDGALLFLASPASSFMTGQVVCVDGGWTAI
jgi:NAD(P)-dependent dehydrogenase (short-subunit alcohol dehydrogenase family)